MFINRPLIHGIVNSKMTSIHSQPKKDSKGNIRVKTLPSQSEKKIIRNIDISRKSGDINQSTDNNLIGIKDIKQMIDNDLQNLISRVSQFQNITISQQHYLIKKQQKQKSRQTVNVKNNNNKQMIQYQLSEQQCIAYEECKQILEARKQQEEKMYEKVKEVIGMKVKEEEERRLELEGVMRELVEEVGRIKLQTSKIEQSLNLHKKKSTTRQSLLTQIQSQLNSINRSNQQLFSSKQQSLTQKNQFIQIQAQQIKLLKQIQQQNDLQLQYNQLIEKQQNYRRTIQMKKRLKKIKQKSQQDVQTHIKQKIDQMTRININIDHLRQQIIQLQVKIHQQVAIIDSLAKRNLQLEQEHQMQQEYRLGEKYRRDYQRMFLNKKNQLNLQLNQQQSNVQPPIEQQSSHLLHSINDTNLEQDLRELNHWQNYKAYLQKILKNQKKLSTNKQTHINQHSSTFLITTKPHSQIIYSDRQEKTGIKKENLIRHQMNLKDRSNADQKMKRLISKSFHPSKRSSSLHTNHPKQLNSKTLNSQSSKPQPSLPRLVRMQGSLKDQDKIKNYLTKLTHNKYDESIELQTIRTSQVDDGQTQIIEVEFRGKKQSMTNKNKQ